MATPARQLSPTALNRFLGCEHRTWLDLLERRGTPAGERAVPRMKGVMERGERHEAAVVERLREEGELVALEAGTPQERAGRTLEAMRAGARVLHQACVEHRGWIGYPDFLIRVERPSRLGPWSYEVHDAKLSTHARPDHVLQLLFYTDAVEAIQELRPSRMHLVLGDSSTASYRPEDFDAYAARLRAVFEERYAVLDGPSPDPAYPWPTGDCDWCHWWQVCEARRREDDHLSLVAGLHRGQGAKLTQAGVTTVGELASLADDAEVPRLARATRDVLRAQAGLQLRSRGRDRPLHELLEPAHDRGLGRLPEPSAGDVHFDFEGDPHWGDEGLEYLFGTVYEDGGRPVYWPLWATSRAEEKLAFETWIDWLTARLVQFPDLHVLHYNAYEVTALKQLAARHATREHELDELLRRRVFVDLYGVTRQAVRVGTESYGLKALEPLVGFERTTEVGSWRRWQDFLEDGDRAHLDAIARYNEEDCLATRALFAWLLDRRPEAEARFGIELAALEPEPPRPPTDRARELQERTDRLRATLLAGLPDDESEDTPEQRARRTAFDLTGYHRREDKPVWWAYFARRNDMTLEQLRDEDGDALAGLEVESVEDVAQSWQWTMRFPAQDHKLSRGSVDEPLAGRGATVVELDDLARRIVVKRGKKTGDDAPVALAPGPPIQTDGHVAALFEEAEAIAADGLDRATPALDLLLRRPPRFTPGTPPLADGPVDLAVLQAQVDGLDRSALVVQGPPGSGKTYTGARLALHLIAQGRRVGVMAVAHDAIDNLVRAIDEAATERGVEFRGWKKGRGYSSARVTCSPAPPSEDEGPVLLHAATSWHWVGDAARESVDVLLVDEAGQVSLADAIAASRGARSVVLLGDPQQLAHVSQGTHPLGSGASVLEHLLDGAATVPPDRGVLLSTSWRMHPDVCAFVSQTMYDGRLSPVAGLERQRIDSPGLSGSGLRLVGVEHSDNRGRSEEEADRIAEEVELLLRGRWTDARGHEHPLTLDDVLVVAPYNAQVRCLRAKLPDEARVGTVDKFQGQQAPVVLFSMASSSGEDVSRGMSFLFSRNRLNVAVSRAQAMAVVVCSPRLLAARCSTVEDMRLVNMLCRFADAARA